jgi:hypothetical protein
MRAPPGEQDDGLEQAGLAGRVRTVDELRPGTEVGLEVRVAPKIAQVDRLEQFSFPGEDPASV